MGAPAESSPAGRSRTALWSWALYDLANTIYSALVVTGFLIPLYVARHGSRTPVAIASSATLLASAFVSPRLGARVDRTGRARPGVDFWTVVCCAASAALFWAIDAGPAPALAVYASSLFAYQCALTYSNALLPVVAPPHRRGFASGLGVGLGYAGIPIALVLAKVVMKTPLGDRGAFLLSGALMALGSIPLWLHVKDPPRRAEPGSSPSTGGFLAAFRWAKTQPLLMSLLVANFVCADVANTLIQYATDYFTSYVGVPLETALTCLIALSGTALVGGLVVGRLADRVPPVALYAGGVLALVTGLVAAAAAPGTTFATGWLVATGGVGIATIWSVGRQLVMRVSPPERYGEALGLYGVTTKASVVGTTVFAVLVDGFGYAVAILSQAAVLLGGALLVVAFGRRLARAGGEDVA